jgi:hypothetical protein
MAQILLGFLRKYRHSSEYYSSLPLFLKKLRQKGQSADNIRQAERAINFYSNIIKEPASVTNKSHDANYTTKQRTSVIKEPPEPPLVEDKFIRQWNNSPSAFFRTPFATASLRTSFRR